MSGRGEAVCGKFLPEVPLEPWVEDELPVDEPAPEDPLDCSPAVLEGVEEPVLLVLPCEPV